MEALENFSEKKLSLFIFSSFIKNEITKCEFIFEIKIIWCTRQHFFRNYCVLESRRCLRFFPPEHSASNLHFLFAFSHTCLYNSQIRSTSNILRFRTDVDFHVGANHWVFFFVSLSLSQVETNSARIIAGNGNCKVYTSMWLFLLWKKKNENSRKFYFCESYLSVSLFCVWIFLHFAIIGLIQLLLITGEYAFHLIITIFSFGLEHISFTSFCSSERSMQLCSGHIIVLCASTIHICTRKHRTQQRSCMSLFMSSKEYCFSFRHTASQILC